MQNRPLIMGLKAGKLTEGDTVDLLIKVACFIKKVKYFYFKKELI
jgi:hypothetical protein